VASNPSLETIPRSFSLLNDPWDVARWHERTTLECIHDRHWGGGVGKEREATPAFTNLATGATDLLIPVAARQRDGVPASGAMKLCEDCSPMASCSQHRTGQPRSLEALDLRWEDHLLGHSRDTAERCSAHNSPRSRHRGGRFPGSKLARLTGLISQSGELKNLVSDSGVLVHGADGHKTEDGPLKWFAIAGADQKFVPAEAKIEGNALVVSSPGVSTPVAERLTWDNFPEGCVLYHAAGLPAVPFRTDRRPYEY
jgi:hypothetical protein